MAVVKPPRQRTAIRMQQARERLDALEAQEDAGAAPPASSPRVTLILWLCVIVLGAAIYFLVAWFERR